MDDADDDLIARIGAGAYGYFAGGAGDEITLRANRESRSGIQLLPRVLVDVAARDTSVQVLGQRWPHPIAVAPMAYQRHAHPDGEAAMAVAAAAIGAGTMAGGLAAGAAPAWSGEKAQSPSCCPLC